MLVGVAWNVEGVVTLIIIDTLHLYVLLVESDIRLSLSQEAPPSVSTS